MNERALEQGFFVLYPAQAQAQDANPSRCWNWFKHNHQQRGMDSSRVYIAGLSAGGAMAAIVAQAYPDIFAAAGIHSGLPQGAASNVSEALAVMKSGSPARGMQGSWTRRPQAPSTPTSTPAHMQLPVPTIVFHGDQDHTVHPHNGEQVIAGVMWQIPPISTSDLPNPSARGVQVEHGTSINGRSIHAPFITAMMARPWPSIGWFMARATPGPEASPKVRTQTPGAPMPREKCFDSSSNIRVVLCHKDSVCTNAASA